MPAASACALLALALATRAGAEPADSYHEYAIIGAGPGGLQLAAMLAGARRDHVLIERATQPGSFFTTQPRNRRLSSMNKRYTGTSDEALNLRFDWNSLLDGDGRRGEVAADEAAAWTTAAAGNGTEPARRSRRFVEFSDEYYPPADTMLEYMASYALAHAPHILYSTAVQRVVRVGKEEGGGEGAVGEGAARFTLHTTRGVMRCKYLIVATGLSEAMPVSESLRPHVEDYENVMQYTPPHLNSTKYDGLSILVVGSSNHALDVAEGMLPFAETLHVLAERPDISLGRNEAARSHYVGSMRSASNVFAESMSLKTDSNEWYEWPVQASHANFFTHYVKQTTYDVRRGVTKVCVSLDGVIDAPEQTQSSSGKKSGGHEEEKLHEGYCKLEYDKVINALGRRFGLDIFDGGARPELESGPTWANEDFEHNTMTGAHVHSLRQKQYPRLRPGSFESSNQPGMFFAGTLLHVTDYRRSAGGVIAGFRHLGRALFRSLERAHHGVPWPAEPDGGLDGEELRAAATGPGSSLPEAVAARVLLRAVRNSAGALSMHGSILDLVLVCNSTDSRGRLVRLLVDVPVAFVKGLLADDATMACGDDGSGSGHGSAHAFALSFGYGRCNSADGNLDVLGARASKLTDKDDSREGYQAAPCSNILADVTNMGDDELTPTVWYLGQQQGGGWPGKAHIVLPAGAAAGRSDEDADRAELRKFVQHHLHQAADIAANAAEARVPAAAHFGNAAGWERCGSERLAAIIQDNSTLTQADRSWLHRTLLEDIQAVRQAQACETSAQPYCLNNDDHSDGPNYVPSRVTAQDHFTVDNYGRKALNNVGAAGEESQLCDSYCEGQGRDGKACRHACRHKERLPMVAFALTEGWAITSPVAFQEPPTLPPLPGRYGNTTNMSYHLWHSATALAAEQQQGAPHSRRIVLKGGETDVQTLAPEDQRLLNQKRKSQTDAIRNDQPPELLPSSNRTHAEYLILGSGAGGLQLARALQLRGLDYLVVEKGSVPSGFFRRFPRHRNLISINKRFFSRGHPDFALRHDWNSLLSTLSNDAYPHDERLLFRNHNKSYFPQADSFVRYLEHFAAVHALRVRYNTTVQSVRRLRSSAANACSDGDETCAASEKEGGGQGGGAGGYKFALTIADGTVLRCRTLILGTGLGGQETPLDVDGVVEGLTETYGTMARDVSAYRNRSVLVVGKRNSAMETASQIAGVAARVDMVSTTPHRMATVTRYGNDLRAVNDDFLDSAGLGSGGGNNLIVSMGRISRAAGHAFVREHGGTGRVLLLRNASDVARHAAGERVRPMLGTAYDHVIMCTGFRVDDSIFNATLAGGGRGEADGRGLRPALAGGARFLALTHEYESTNEPGLFAVGALMHVHDAGKASGGSVNGYRYLARALAHMLAWKDHGQRWPVASRIDAAGLGWHAGLTTGSRLQDESAGLHVTTWLANRIVTGSSLWQMFGQVVDVIIALRAAGGGALLDVVGLHDVPIQYVDELVRSFARPEHAAARGLTQPTSPIVQVYTLALDFVECANKRCGKLHANFFDSQDQYWKIHGEARYYELDLSDDDNDANKVFPPRPCWIADSSPAPPLAIHKVEGPSDMEYERHYLPLGSFVLDTVGGMSGIRDGTTTARQATVDTSTFADQMAMSGAPSCGAYFAWHAFHWPILGRTGVQDRWPDRMHTDGDRDANTPSTEALWRWYAGLLQPQGAHFGAPCSSHTDCAMPAPHVNASLPAGSSELRMQCSAERICELQGNQDLPGRMQGWDQAQCKDIEPPCPNWCMERAQQGAQRCVAFPSSAYRQGSAAAAARQRLLYTMAEDEKEEEEQPAVDYYRQFVAIYDYLGRPVNRAYIQQKLAQVPGQEALMIAAVCEKYHVPLRAVVQEEKEESMGEGGGEEVEEEEREEEREAEEKGD